MKMLRVCYFVIFRMCLIHVCVTLSMLLCLLKIVMVLKKLNEYFICWINIMNWGHSTVLWTKKIKIQSC